MQVSDLAQLRCTCRGTRRRYKRVPVGDVCGAGSADGRGRRRSSVCTPTRWARAGDAGAAAGLDECLSVWTGFSASPSTSSLLTQARRISSSPASSCADVSDIGELMLEVAPSAALSGRTGRNDHSGLIAWSSAARGLDPYCLSVISRVLWTRWMPARRIGEGRDPSGFTSRRSGRTAPYSTLRSAASGPLWLCSRTARASGEAVVAGLTLHWRSGAVEGHANRVKTVKRQMFGRAGLQLLRKRVLLA